jgi:D-serine deaminase-like pyridoxal phosphate-dependent protein
LNHELILKKIGRPVILMDLDRVDHNLSVMARSFETNGKAFRLVAKSMPSIELIHYICQKVNTHKLMAFHVPFLPLYLELLGKDADILLGKTIPVEAAAEFYKTYLKKHNRLPPGKIQWLVDSVERLNQYMNLARELKTQLLIAFEIDVGLHRGGFDTLESFVQGLSMFEPHGDHIRFVGLMGYDGHVPFAPPLLKSEQAVVENAFAATMAKYQSFVDVGKKTFPHLFNEAVVLNSGGSRTYPFYTPEMAPNDLAMGSGIVKPGTYDIYALQEHREALFIGAPVIAQRAPIKYPYIETFPSIVTWWNPNLAQMFVVYGGGWAATQIYPEGVMPDFLAGDVLNENQSPNKSLMFGSQSIELKAGDFVFFRPNQADAIRQFDTIQLFRGLKWIGEWATLPIGF